MLPPDVAEFRAQFTAKYISPRYSGNAHFAFTSIASLSVILYSLSGIHALRAPELLAVPLTFLFANFVEYRAHKGVMHHRTRGFGLVFDRHTPSHHGFYRHDAMAAESPRDYYMVLFPPLLIVFFFGLFALPVGLLLGWLATPNIARLFVATAIGYFLTYEWLHFAYHQPPDGLIGRLWLVRVLRRHHRVHHDHAHMQKHNFNITFPICDALFGTTYRDERR
jgi:Fatty acid hydroxylase superfamily